jgi:RNA polymerase sigma factor for flagellar operon FliA
MREALVQAIKNLPEREQYVMSMYCEHDMNLKEIAAVLKVTESRVCQLHSQSIARLRTRLREWQGRGAKLPEHMSAVEYRSAA